MNTSYLLDNRIKYICDYDYTYFLQKQNVEAIGLGYKEIKGFCTFKKCIKVFVSKKVSLDNLYKKDLIPSIYKYIPTDVVESGIFKCCGLRKKIRPTLCGYSISPVGPNYTGTLGCLVRNKREKSFYILSSSHILSNLGTLSFGTPIVQPGVSDGGKLQTDVVANLIKYVPIKFKGTFSTPENYVDGAIAKISNLSLISPTMAILSKDLNPIGIPTLQEKIMKIGRTTGYTEGYIKALNATQLVNFSNKRALFKNQIVCDINTKEGDSGSLLINSNMNPLGLLMGNSTNKNYAVFNDINTIISLLNVEIFTGTNV